MGRLEARGDSSGTMNNSDRSEVECLLTASTCNDTGGATSSGRPSHDIHSGDTSSGRPGHDIHSGDTSSGRPGHDIHSAERRQRQQDADVRTSAAPVEVKKHQHKHNLKHRYEVMETLGKGTYGKVKKAVERANQKTVAIKSIRKERITDDLDRVHIQREIEITSSLRHPNIIRFYEVFESRDKIVIVMEYASRGELYDYVHEHRRLSESQARDIFRQITSAIHYCHKNGVVHRDLKLENILLDQDLNVKLADFGLSKRFQKNKYLQTFCGSPLYASPEIVKGLPYQGPEVDCWALGVLLYALVYGSMPFDGTSHATLTEQISQGRYHKPTPPSDACALIDWLLTVRADDRATVEDVANHWWVNWGHEESVCDCPSPPHQDCPSPLLARYIDWQNQIAASNAMPVDPSCLFPDSSYSSPPSTRTFSFSFPLKGEHGAAGRARGGTSSLRKSRKENAIPQTSPRASGCAAAVAASAASSSSSVERRKPKGILKPQRSLDSSFLHTSSENSPTQPCSNAAPQPCRQLALAHANTEVLSTSLTPPSTFSQPSFKMPKKGILKNQYQRECGCSSYPQRQGCGLDSGVGGIMGGFPGEVYSCEPSPRRPSSADDSPTMRTEAVRRRKGILKRNGKFSRSLDLPDDRQSTSSNPATFPEVLQRLLQAAGAVGGTEGSFSRPSSLVSEDSLLSSDSFDLLDLSVQSHRRIFTRGIRRSACSSEEDLEELRPETGAVEPGGRQRQGEEEGGRKEMLW